MINTKYFADSSADTLEQGNLRPSADVLSNMSGSQSRTASMNEGTHDRGVSKRGKGAPGGGLMGGQWPSACSNLATRVQVGSWDVRM